MSIYMQFGSKVKGSVTEANHVDWVELSSFQWGLGRGVSQVVGSSHDREVSAPSISEVVVTKNFDKASNSLFQAAIGADDETCKIHFCRSDKGVIETFWEIELSNTLISGWSVSSGGDRPSESISLNFSKIISSVKTADVSGDTSSARVLYDLATAKPS